MFIGFLLMTAVVVGIFVGALVAELVERFTLWFAPTGTNSRCVLIPAVVSKPFIGDISLRGQK
jgi:hypothetical protein